MKFTDLNFNFAQMEKDFLKLLIENVDPMFIANEDKDREVLASFTVFRRVKEVEIEIMPNGKFCVTLSRNGLHTFYCTGDDKVTTEELVKLIPDIKMFLKNGFITNTNFEKIAGQVDDWPTIHSITVKKKKKVAKKKNR